MDLDKEKIYLNGLNVLLKSSYSKLFNLIKANFNNLKEISFEKIWENIKDPEKQKIDLDKEWQKIKNEGFNLLTINDPNYPSLLKNINYPPFGIYLLGKLKKDLLPLAVVGTRKPSEYGKRVTLKIIKDLVDYGFTIVSGLAFGIDSLAHKTALENKGETIAVLGSGFKKITPLANISLAKKISANGALISEYHPLTPSFKQNFPWRNRIISGLSLGVLIIEANEKSGALITAQFAFQQKRPVFAIPGSIFSSTSQGTNNLIKNGAKLVVKIDDILKELKIENIPFKKKSLNLKQKLNPKEILILKNLNSDSPLSLDKIIEMTNLKANEIMVILTELELKGLIKEIKSGYFIKI